MNMKEQGINIGKIISKAWADETFKQRLLADTSTVLMEEGIDIPDGLTIMAVENTDTLFHLVIPPKQMPASLDLSELASIAGGRVLNCSTANAPNDFTGEEKSCYK